jgi:hypothetical protein
MDPPKEQVDLPLGRAFDRTPSEPTLDNSAIVSDEASRLKSYHRVVSDGDAAAAAAADAAKKLPSRRKSHKEGLLADDSTLDKAAAKASKSSKRRTVQLGANPLHMETDDTSSSASSDKVNVMVLESITETASDPGKKKKKPKLKKRLSSEDKPEYVDY